MKKIWNKVLLVTLIAAMLATSTSVGISLLSASATEAAGLEEVGITLSDTDPGPGAGFGPFDTEEESVEESAGLYASALAETILEGDGWSFDPATGTLTILSNKAVCDQGSTHWRSGFVDSDYNPQYDVLHLIIGKNVTEIGGFAFSDCYNLLDATQDLYSTYMPIKRNLKRIGVGAFSHCTSLKEFDMKYMSDLIDIGEQAFFRCTSLESVDIGASVKTMRYAFRECTSLEKVTLGAINITAGDAAFIDCPSLSDLTIQDSVTNIDRFMFSGCTSLKSVTFPASVTNIGTSAFSGCTALNEMMFKGNAPVIVDDTFSDTAGGDLKYTSGQTGFDENFLASVNKGAKGFWVYQVQGPNLLLNQSERYSFANSSSNFGSSSYYYVSDSDFLKLSNYVKNEYDESYAKYIINDIQYSRNSKWIGSCYGMAATAILDKNGQINMKALVSPPAGTLWQLPKPSANSKIESAINYYNLSQYIDFLDVNHFYNKSQIWSVGLQKLVQDAKDGNLIFFIYYYSMLNPIGVMQEMPYGHVIVIIGYEAGDDGSHNLIAYDNRSPNINATVEVSSDYKTCSVFSDRTEYVSSLNFLSGDEMNLFDKIKYDGTPGSSAGNLTLNTTEISVSAAQGLTVTNKAGQTLVCNAGSASGTMPVSGRKMVVNSTADGSPAPATPIFTVPNSDQFTFETNGNGLDVTVMNDGIFAAVESDKADTVIISKDEGVSVLGSGGFDFSMSLGLNSDICDMVTLSGTANQEASLKFNADGAVVQGNFNQNTKLTVFSNTVNVNHINFSTKYNEVLITKQAGKIDVRASSKGNGIFDVSVIEHNAGTSTSTAATTARTTGAATKTNINTNTNNKARNNPATGDDSILMWPYFAGIALAGMAGIAALTVFMRKRRNRAVM